MARVLERYFGPRKLADIRYDPYLQDLATRDIAPYSAVKWIPPGFAWVDPLKDIKAQIMAVRAGFKSRAEAVSEQGYDSEEIDHEIAADNERADSLGLATSGSGGRRRSAT